MSRRRPEERLRYGAATDRIIDTVGLGRFARSDGLLDSAKVMSFAIHSCITGALYRIGGHKRLPDTLLAKNALIFMQGREVMDWYLGTGSDV